MRPVHSVGNEHKGEEEGWDEVKKLHLWQEVTKAYHGDDGSNGVGGKNEHVQNYSLFFSLVGPINIDICLEDDFGTIVEYLGVSSGG